MSEAMLLLRRKMEDAIEEGVFPGGVLLVYSKGDVVFFEAFGYSMIYPEKRIMKTGTYFDVASLTKVVVTVSIVMGLVEKGLIQIDQKLRDFYPDIDTKKAEITIGDLLSHSSGLPSWHPIYLEIEEEGRRTGVGIMGGKKAWDFAIKRINEMALLYEPGSRHIYSDLGFILLGDIIMKVTGKGLSEVFREIVGGPLGMNDSFFREKGAAVEKGGFTDGDFAATELCTWRKKVVVGEVHDENAFAFGGVAPHAGLFTTAYDLLKFSLHIMECYKGVDGLWKASTVRRFLKRREGSTWTLGWDTPSRDYSLTGRYLSEESFGHFGFTGCSLWIDTKKDTIIILLTNRVHPTRSNERIKYFRPQIHDLIMYVTGDQKP